MGFQEKARETGRLRRADLAGIRERVAPRLEARRASAPGKPVSTQGANADRCPPPAPLTPKSKLARVKPTLPGTAPARTEPW